MSQSGWDCNPHDYQYDMTAFLSLVTDNGETVDLTNYEVAAFVGDDCRGVAEVQTISESQQYLYCRIRSNIAGGENITFKVYNKKTNSEVDFEAETLTFQSNDRLGLPSAPFLLSLKAYTLGDVNGDGRINVTDIQLVINKMFGKALPSTFIEAAADLNEDGRVNVTDIQLIINIMFNR